MQKDLEAIKVFAHFEKLLRTSTAWPLVYDNLNIQNDEYKRLAGDSNESSEPFATLDCNKKTTDTNFRFRIEFYPKFFLIHIEGAGLLGGEFSTRIFPNEQTAAKQLFETITMLASGQIAVLESDRFNIPCATELLLYHGDKIIVLMTTPNFRWWWSKKELNQDDATYDCKVLKNSYVDSNIKVPSNFFMFEKDAEDNLKRYGRDINPGKLSPLTKSEYYNISDQLILNGMGFKDPNESFEAFLFTRWEVYVVAAVVASLTLLANKIQLIPPLIQNHFIILVPVLYIVTVGLSTFVLNTKEHLRKENPESLWFKIDNLLQSKKFLSGVYLVLQLATIAVFFMPNIAYKGTNTVTSFFKLSSQFPICYIALQFLTVGLLAATVKSKAIRLLGCICYLIGNVLLWYFNDLYTNPDATSITDFMNNLTVGILALGLVLTIIYGIVLARSLFANKPSTQKL